MNVQEAHGFTNKERLAVLSTITDTGQQQSALLGMAVTQQLEIIFDTVNSSRKHPNLKKNPRVAWVLGCATEVTVQYEGVAEGVSGRRVGQVQKDLFRRISGWNRTGELAGHYLFCNQRVGGLRSGNFRSCGLAERLERQTGCGWKSGGEPPHSKAH
jgi:hypothetical protein